MHCLTYKIRNPFGQVGCLVLHLAVYGRAMDHAVVCPPGS